MIVWKRIFSMLSVVCVLLGSLAEAADRPPNVVLIISDDQAWTDYGFMGHKTIQTPRLDKLARESATFRRGYVPTALCRPSLATIITGLYPATHQITGNDPAPLPNVPRAALRRDPKYRELREQLIAKIDKLPTIPKLLAKRGYQSHQSGKWWEGNFRRGGFTAGMTHGDPMRGGRHGDMGLAIGRKGMKAVFDFIDSCGDKPFFVWYAPFLPHTPHTPPPRLLKKYQNSDRPLALAKYYAMCEWFDETCGALLDHIDDRGLREDTLVVYVTDNGWIQRTPATQVPPGWRTSFAPRSKQSPNEGGTRTPIMLRWPGKIKPADRSEVVSSIDLAPTILAAAGMKPPRELPGINLLEVCQGKPTGREAIFGESYAHDIADINDPSKSLLYRWCIRGRWKLILTYGGKVGRYKAVHVAGTKGPQLYDLRADPREETNLAGQKPQLAQRIDRFAKR